jgi:hypothetical protein
LVVRFWTLERPHCLFSHLISLKYRSPDFEITEFLSFYTAVPPLLPRAPCPPTPGCVTTPPCWQCPGSTHSKTLPWLLLNPFLHYPESWQCPSPCCSHPRSYMYNSLLFVTRDKLPPHDGLHFFPSLDRPLTVSPSIHYKLIPPNNSIVNKLNDNALGLFFPWKGGIFILMFPWFYQSHFAIYDLFESLYRAFLPWACPHYSMKLNHLHL